MKKVDLFQGHFLKSQISKAVKISIPSQPHLYLNLKIVDNFEELIE